MCQSDKWFVSGVVKDISRTLFHDGSTSASSVYILPVEMIWDGPAPLSMEFSRQEYWRGLPFPTPENLSGPGIEPMSLNCR